MSKILKKVDDLEGLLKLLPPRIQNEIRSINHNDDLVEIVMDLGKHAEIRYNDELIRLDQIEEITQADINTVVDNIGEFNTDNRAGIERTLHRISGIRSRQGKVIGLTCRIGRAVQGSIEMVRDILESNKNILFLGPPGIGKTTNLRECARVLSDDLNKRVVIVDTSNEIGGDGDVAHPGIGTARRMQVPSPDQQHHVMIEAVENHMPEVIVVDEIGTEAEAQAARTIAERGVQLVATAHGHTLENLLKNPTLSDLLGGIQSVILGDEEAKFRGTQKTILERKYSPTFDTLIEIRDRDMYAIYHDIDNCVDLCLRHDPVDPELRDRRHHSEGLDEFAEIKETAQEKPKKKAKKEPEPVDTLVIFPFGINISKINNAIHALQVPVSIASNIGEADIVLTMQTHLKGKSKLSAITQGRQLPIHVIKRSSHSQICDFLRRYFHMAESDEDFENEALREAEKASIQVREEHKIVDLAAQPAFLRRKQHKKIEEMGLNSLSIGSDESRRVRIYPKKESD